jgi:hypothetical protein
VLVARPDDRLIWLDQVGDPLPVACADGVTERFMEVALLGIPLAGAQVQGRHRFAFRLLESVAQGLGKEGMVAIPLPSLIRSHDE